MCRVLEDFPPYKLLNSHEISRFTRKYHPDTHRTASQSSSRCQLISNHSDERLGLYTDGNLSFKKTKQPKK